MNALLIAAQTKDDFYDLSYQLDELRALVETIDIKVAYTLSQKLDKINPAKFFFLGLFITLCVKYSDSAENKNKRL